ncbi:MAG: hypothetical protein ABID87_02780 [Chloroflexota bacterium]
MEAVIVSIICITLVVFGGMTMSQGFFTSVDASTSGLERMSSLGEDIMRTEMATVNASMPSANTLYIRLTNNGQTKVADFSKWDVIVQYYDSTGTYYVKWLPYNEGALGNDEWQKSRIYLAGGQPEVFDPDIVNPGETIEIEAKLDPAVGSGTTNMAVVSTPNGIPASAYFSR